jgi:hypothetical protein
MNNKWVSLSPTNIKAIEFAEKPNHLVKSNLKIKKPTIKIQFEKGGSQGLNMMYLQNGISWTPTYLLTLLSDTEANLKLQAEVTNNVEHIKNCDINFVVGVPNFKYATQPATLTTLTQMAREMVTGVSNTSRKFNNAFSNALIPSQTYSEEAMADYEELTVYNESNDTEQNEDLYFYNVKNVDLEKDGRAHYPLFESKVKIKHLYECVLPYSQVNSYYYRDESFSFDTKLSNVYHTIEIKNDTKNPFTTGPIMIVNEQKAIAQDLLKYTATGLTSSIKLTQASDIRVEEKEKITSTTKTMFNKESYSFVTLQSEVVIINSKNQDIDFSLNKSIMGTLKNVSEKYTSHSKVLNNNVNPVETFNIKITLKAKETKKISYTYQVYVR